MLLLPKAAVERNAPRADGGNRESLIKEGARGGDFLLFHHSGSSFASTYSVVHKIGEGGFGKVFAPRLGSGAWAPRAATHRTTGIMRAVKRLRKVPGRQELHKNELNALLGLDHPHIEYLYLVFELCEGLDLLETIRRSKAGRLGQLEASVVLRHMLKALQCCHAQYRGHYDIKPENFMFKRETNGDIAHANLKMVDLGLSSCFDMHRENRISGTTAYMAPEFWSGIYGPEGDVWSCGVVLFVMLTGTPLLDDISPATVKREILVRHLLRDRITSAAEEYNLSASALDLLMQMLQHDRHARPTIKEALKHRFNHDVYELEKAFLGAG
ncbi:Calcium-dependent protein kinase 28 [Durusdinium trenchii]|uniref:Calcium-dependent protein kinase 28 n=1 Tax=Durusdinium trenchii TaxID=1381693 RepID=A0ABP0I6Y4_9DINO